MRPSGRVPLAWRNLTHKRMALLVSVAAVSFAILIMFMQMGFLNGLYDSQTSLVRALRADLVMLSRAQHTLVGHEPFLRERLIQAAGCPGVKGVYPLYLEETTSYLRHPRSGRENAIRAIGFRPEDPVFASPQIDRQAASLKELRSVLFDTRSRRFFGPLSPGSETELGSQKVRVVGTFSLSADYYYDGTLLMSDQTLFRLFAEQRSERVNLGVIQLAAGVSPSETERALRSRLPADVEVLSVDAAVTREKQMWRKATPAGYVFGMGILVGFVIGAIISYQILYTDIVDHLRQLATLKAIGFDRRALIALVVEQGLLLGLLGYLPGLLLSFGLYEVLTMLTGIVMRLTVGRAIVILLLTVGMSMLSAVLAVRRALAADPAELF